MRIIISADTYYPNVGGASYFSQRLASGLLKRGHQVLVIASSRGARSEFFKHEGVDIFGLHSFPIGIYKNFRLPFPFFIKESIKKVMKDFRPDVVHVQGHFWLTRAVVLSAFELGIPVMGTSHFMPENVLHYFHFPPVAQKIAWRIAWKQFRDVFDRLDVVTTPTQTAIRVLKEVGYTKPVLAISCGIDLNRFNPHNNGEYLRERYKIPKKPVLLYVGRLDKEKNIDTILRAVAVALKKIDFHFVMAGIGSMDKYLYELAESLGIREHVTFTGFMPDEDLPNLYSIANCFVIAGMAELQSIVTLEALASGLPAIAVNYLALPELVRPGENGYLFEPNDNNTLAEDIVKILSDKNLEMRMREKSLEIIRAHDFENTLRHFELLYKSLQ